MKGVGMVMPNPTSVSNGNTVFGIWSAFFWAAGGSFALEVVAILNSLRTQKTADLPVYYKSWIFWVARVALGGIAGALAIAEGASNPLVAINIGASAPAIVELLGSKPPRAESAQV
jgi:hypothetical protein